MENGEVAITVPPVVVKLKVAEEPVGPTLQTVTGW
jgi:hypothetical protein